MAHIAERIAQAILAERLVDNTGTSDDDAYNAAIDTAVETARRFVGELDPLPDEED